MKNKGFIQIIIIVALLVIILSLLGVSLNSLFSNPILKDNFGFLGRGIVSVWFGYLSAPFTYLWNTFAGLIWQPFINAMQSLKQGINPYQNIYK